MLDVRRLRLLRELQIRGTIAAVADVLRYSPSAVSQALTQLERETGVTLTERSGRRVRLTPQAEILVRHTETLLATMETAEAELDASHTTVAGTVRVAVFQTAVLALMPATLAIVRTEHPAVRVEMVQHEPEAGLAETWARDFDLVVAEQYPGHAAPWHANLDRQELMIDAVRLATPPAGVGIGERSRLEDAHDAPWVMEPRPAASRHFAEQVCRVAGFEPDVRFETADLEAQIRLIESGNAVALIPDLLWRGHEPSCSLADLADGPARTIFTAARRSGAMRPAVVAVRAALERAAADAPGASAT